MKLAPYTILAETQIAVNARMSLSGTAEGQAWSCCPKQKQKPRLAKKPDGIPFTAKRPQSDHNRENVFLGEKNTLLSINVDL